MASVTHRPERNTWEVRWRELRVTVDGEGNKRKRWASRRKSCPTQATARALARKIEETQAIGQEWVEERREAKSTLRVATLAFVRSAVDAGAPVSTQRYRSAMMGSFLDYIDAREEDDRGADRPMTDLSLSLLQRYAQALPDDIAESTRHRKVQEVEKMWAWAYDRPERFPGVPTPRRYTGTGADKLSAPPPMVALAVPSWDDVDAMTSHLHIQWHRRAAIVMRYTGARASQVCGLKWSDLNLDRGILHLMAGRRGAKRGRGRVVPLAPPLLAELRVWQAEDIKEYGTASGLLFPRRYGASKGSKLPKPYRGDALTAPFRRAWAAAKVEEAKWGAGDDRGKGSPTHAIRRCVRTGLIRLGVEEALALHLVGQSQGHTAAAYVPQDTPEQSPYWPRLVQAVQLIPDHREAGQ